MNVLLLGKTDSIFTRDFCKNILDSDEMNTVILTQALSKEYWRDYEAANVKQVKWPDCFLKGIRKQLSVLLYLPGIWGKLRQEIGFKNKIDIIHVHYVEPLHLLYFFPFWNRAKRRILTFWGSDIYTITQAKKVLLRYFLKHASSIIFMISNQYEFFQSIYGHKYDDKVKIIDFGNGLIDELDVVMSNYSKEDCKNHFKMPLDKLSVHIGYNASRAQQHLEIVEKLLLLPKDTLAQMELVFSVAYKCDDDFESYKRQLTDMMDKAKMSYRFFDEYLQGEELAMFRRACDLFVYGQKTDARSESPLEYVYAGAGFLCPGWLADNYELLDQSDIRYYVYDDFNTLCESVQLCLDNIDAPEGKISEWGRQKIREEISWDAVGEKWRKLYER
ncbi:MAG: glycosyltransferase [Bacillota bacterium]|nr:glycosyltransferase [Bacillota bacterium]